MNIYQVRSIVESVAGFAHDMRDFTREDAQKLLKTRILEEGTDMVTIEEVKAFFMGMDKLSHEIREVISKAYNNA
jgi:hypothetical protein